MEVSNHPYNCPLAPATQGLHSLVKVKLKKKKKEREREREK